MSDGDPGGRAVTGSREKATTVTAALHSTPATSSVWWAHLAHADQPDQHSIVAVHSDRFPSGTAVDLTAQDPGGRRPTGWLVDLRFRATDGHVVRATVSAAVAEPGLPLWFAEVPQAAGGLPATSLLAFAGTAFPPGAVARPHEVAVRGVRMRHRIGELRWWVRSGVVDTVTVEPVFRRRGVGRTLVTVAEALRVLRGWAPLRSDGRLTDQGAAWLDGSPAYWRPRLAERTEHLRPAGDEDGPRGVTRLLR